MITCTNCGKQNDNDYYICTSCGVRLWDESGPSAAHAPEWKRPVTAPVPPQWPAYTPPMQPQPLMVQRPHNYGYRCPFCQSAQPPYVRQKISTGGWVTFIILFFFCLPLFWIGLLMKEDYRQCSACGMILG